MMKLNGTYRLNQCVRLNEGERQALFADKWARYGKRISYFIAMILPAEREYFEDLFQDVMMKIFENILSYDPSRPFEVWAYRIVRNSCIDHLRARRSHSIINESIPDVRNDPDGMIIRSELDEAIRGALNRLDPDDRQIAYLRFFEEMRFGQIAAVMDMNVNTVKTRMTAIKRKLKSELEDWI